MARITIIPSDNAVYVDGVVHADLDLSAAGIPSGIHALQWYDTRGWIEYAAPDVFSAKPANEDITALPSWADAAKAVFDAWTPPPEPEPTPEEPLTP